MSKTLKNMRDARDSPQKFFFQNLNPDVSEQAWKKLSKSLKNMFLGDISVSIW